MLHVLPPLNGAYFYPEPLLPAHFAFFVGLMDAYALLSISGELEMNGFLCPTDKLVASAPIVPFSHQFPVCLYGNPWFHSL